MSELSTPAGPTDRPGTPRSLLPTLARAGSVAWWLVGIGLAVSFAFILFLRLRLVMLPLIIALLITTLLQPLADRLERLGLRRLPATWLVFFGGAAVVIGALVLIVPQTVGQFAQLGEDLESALREIEEWLVTGPLDLSEQQVEGYVNQAIDSIRGDTGSAITSRLLTGAAIAGEILAGIALSLVLVFFFVKDGHQIAEWAYGHAPDDRRAAYRAAGQRAWESLAGYLRGTAITGMLDAVLIGLGLLVIGVPLVLPLAIITFFAAFFPVVGAPTAGLLAVLVALVSGGFRDALTVLALVFVVQQIESYLFAPSIMGRAVRLHAVVVLVVLTTGGLMAGLIGAFLAVPTTAVAVAVVSELRAWDRRGGAPGPVGPPVSLPLDAASRHRGPSAG
ncbi:MAG TPA: AI-2E family transporter [Acidimicrobiales bacterium]|nr:AI-2E family transporter [Acidimicrobiales bacterium]